MDDKDIQKKIGEQLNEIKLIEAYSVELYNKLKAPINDTMAKVKSDERIKSFNSTDTVILSTIETLIVNLVKGDIIKSVGILEHMKQSIFMANNLRINTIENKYNDFLIKKNNENSVSYIG